MRSAFTFEIRVEVAPAADPGHDAFAEAVALQLRTEALARIAAGLPLGITATVGDVRAWRVALEADAS